MKNDLDVPKQRPQWIKYGSHAVGFYATINNVICVFIGHRSITIDIYISTTLA